MSTSQHPIALRLERLVGGDAKLLATVMGLPLVDGIFPALVLAGALSDPAGVVEVGLLVFGGSATLAVILAEMDGTPRQQATAVLAVGAGLVTLAAVEAALAPTIRSLLDLATFERFAAVVIAAVAAKTASARVGEYLPRPALIVGLGLVASFDPTGARVAVVADPALVGRAVAAAGVGTAFALGVAVFAPRLRRNVDVDRFRFGSAVALGLLALSVVGLGFGNAPLAVVGVTALFALDPQEGDRESSAAAEASVTAAAETTADGTTAAETTAADADAGTGAETTIGRVDWSTVGDATVEDAAAIADDSSDDTGNRSPVAYGETADAGTGAETTTVSHSEDADDRREEVGPIHGR